MEAPKDQHLLKASEVHCRSDTGYVASARLVAVKARNAAYEETGWEDAALAGGNDGIALTDVQVLGYLQQAEGVPTCTSGQTLGPRPLDQNRDLALGIREEKHNR
jgi:hypothetical protein